MKKELSEEEQIEECKTKIMAILKEYNSGIAYDHDLEKVVVYDVQTLRFEEIEDKASFIIKEPQ